MGTVNFQICASTLSTVYVPVMYEYSVQQECLKKIIAVIAMLGTDKPIYFVANGNPQASMLQALIW